MTNPKRYKVKDGVTENTLVKNGFSSKYSYYTDTKDLYKNMITLSLLIDKEDNFLVVNVFDGTYPFPAFYNPDDRYHNKLYEQVIKKYHKYMDGLVKKGILTEDKTK